MEKYDIVDLPLFPVEKNSDDWDVISGYLSVCCKTSKIQLSSVWKIINEGLKTEFDHQRLFKLVLPCWVPVHEFENENEFNNICRKGFDITDDGLFINFGVIDIPENPFFKFKSNAPIPETNKTISHSPFEPSQMKNDIFFKNWMDLQTDLPDKTSYDFFFCDVCVGLSMPVSSWIEASYIKRKSLPLGYDSLLILRNSEQDEVIADIIPQTGKSITSKHRITKLNKNNPILESDNNNSYEKIDNLPSSLLPSFPNVIGFKIFNNCQIFPRFLVTIDIFPNNRESFAIPLCINCRDRKANIYCISDEVKLCEVCDEILHNGTDILAKHTRTSLNKAPPDFLGLCDIHQQQECIIYCIVCELAICKLCENHHHHNLSSKSHFVPLLDVYLTIIDDLNSKKKKYKSSIKETSSLTDKAADIIISRKMKIYKKLDEVDDLLKKCTSIAQENKLSVNNIIQNAADQLMYWCERNLAYYLGTRMHHSRNLYEIEKAKAFINYLRRILPAADFLRAWLQHCKFISENSVKTSYEKNLKLETQFPKIDGEIVIYME